ncbi:MgtC/SapB family protein [Halanaerobaculum tunisiense]
MTIISIQQIVTRLFLACLLGGLVGLERERSSRPAGFRTNILVSVGSTLIMIVSIRIHLMFNYPQVDPGRIAAQVVSGIGFLGAGTIIREGFSVKGLTTAAGLWAVAGVGLALGAGLYTSATVATLLVIITLTLLSKVERKLYNIQLNYVLRIKIFDQPGNLGKIGSVLTENDVVIKDISIEQVYDEPNFYLNLTIKKPKQLARNQLITLLTKLNSVIEIQLEKVD